MVTGNGRQGALCWGDPRAIRLTVSHERLFLPSQPPPDPPDTAAILPRLRELLDQGRYAEAAEAVCSRAAAGDPAYQKLVWIDPLAGAATLTLRPHRAAPTTDFRRQVDLGTGVVTQSWRDADGEVTIEAFASRPANAIVLRLTGFSGSLQLGPIDGTPPVPVSWQVDGLTLTARFDTARPGALSGYRVLGRVLQGQVGGDAVLVIRTLLPGEPDPAVVGDFDSLLAAHSAVHGELLGRVRLELDAAPADRSAPTADLLAAPAGPALIERLFDAGRYAIVSSTGELPPTLQGVWSGTWTPPWSSGYTLDGNLPAAVAALLPTGTPELLLPVFDLLESVRDDLRRNARRLYGARGLLTPLHLSTHGRQNHFGPVWCLTFWTAGAAWMSRLYVDYWRYTGDREFLRTRAWPFLREAGEFILDFAQLRDGVAFFSPSYSPENAPAATGSQACVNATMDIATTRDLLTNLLRCGVELGLDDPDAPHWRALLAVLPPYRVANGLLAEWCHPGLTDQPAHRHASHLWPLWYEPDPLITEDPALRAAAAATVRSRLAWWLSTESDEMAYGLAQLGLAAAALGMAEEAWATVQRMASRYWRPSLVPTHNRDALFNVDIAGGLPAVITAMLVRSAHGRLDLLPALPAAWPRGRVTGLHARDAVRIDDLRWEPGRVAAVLTAQHDVVLTVGLPGAPDRRLRLPAGQPVAVSAS
jgi:alpha-L-fucosidase 2